MEKKRYFVGVDIGTTNVVMVVGSQVDDEPVKIEGLESQPIDSGVTAGKIINVQKTGEAIRLAKERLEKGLNIKIEEAYAGFASENVRCVQYTDHVFVKDSASGCIAQEDVDSLHERMQNVIADQSEEIMSRSPLCYIIDNDKEVADPVGSFGLNLSAKFLFILCQKEQLKRIKMSFQNAGLRLQNVYINPAVEPDVLLSDEEREEGVAIVDIGGGTTDVAIVRNGLLRYIASVPMGAQSINTDMHTFGIAERLTSQFKHKYGSAVSDMIPEEATIPIQMAGQAKKDYPQRNLVAIIEARLKDIIEYAWNEIKIAKMSTKIPCGIVITGGSALLDNIDELFHRETKVPARLGRVQYGGLSLESCEKFGIYANVAAIGIMLSGSQHAPSAVVKQKEIVRPVTTLAGGGVQRPRPVGSTSASASQPVQQPKSKPKSEPVADGVTNVADDVAEKQKAEPSGKTKSGDKGKGRSRGLWKTLSNTLDTILGNNKDEVL